MKRIISWIVLVLFVFSMSIGVLAEVGMEISLEDETSVKLMSEYPYPQLLEYDDLDTSFENIAKAKILQEYQEYVLNAIKYHIESSTDDYRVAKNLLQLFNADQDGNVVFFFDGCSANLDGATYGFSGYIKNGNRYNTSAVCIVVRVNANGHPEIVYATADASTMADNVRNASLNNNINVSITKDGIYGIRTVNHNGQYAALNILVTEGASLRCPEAGCSYDATADGINIHARSYNSDALTSSTRSSTGCFNVGKHKSSSDYSDYNSFIYSMTGVTNARNNTFPSNGVSNWKNVGITIVDRSNYKTQLATIFGDDNSTKGYSGEEIAAIITDSSAGWHDAIVAMGDTEPPTNAKLSVNKQTATIGEIVRFSFSADYAKQYWLQIYKDEARVYSIDLGSSSEYEMSFDTSGEYSAYVSCSNGLGYVDSTWISFIIHNNLPQNATLSLNKSIVEINESVVYSYSADYANQYWLQIFKDDTKLYSIDLGNGTEYEISFETPGVYSAYVSCSNGLGYIDSSWINLIVHNNEPQNAELTLNKSIALIDEPVVFSYSADYANQYWLQIYKDEVSVYSIDLGNSNEYVMSFEEPGEYSAYISCSNSSGYVDSEWINLTVHNNTPDNAKLNTDKFVVFVNEDVIFSYSADYANQYWLQVFKNEERVYSIDLGNSSEYKMSFETPGEYFVYVSCSSKLGYTDSEWIKIIVKAESIVVKSNNDEYYVNVNVSTRKNASIVIVGGYLFGKLQQTKILQYNDVLTDTTLIGDFDEIRIFSLENQSSIKPICVHETIPSSSFITE